MPTPGLNPASPLKLQFPQSLAVYDDYAKAQKTVDFLADADFPVEQLMIVGTDLKRIERVTGRLTWSKIAVGGILSGLWFGVFIGLIFVLFTNAGLLEVVLSTALMGATFGLVWALIGYAFTRGQRDFSSVTQVVATKYEVLVRTSTPPRRASCSPGCRARCRTRSPELTLASGPRP